MRNLWKPDWDPRTFDPVRLGNQETDAWAAYYRREWLTFLRSAVGMVRTGFGTDPVRTLVGAFHVLRANQLWAPYPDNDPDGARASMRRFYAMVAKDGGFPIDPTRASALEVEWWRLHREHQHDPEVTAAALDHSDAWVSAGCHPDDPHLAAERRALVASHTALRRAVDT